MYYEQRDYPRTNEDYGGNYSRSTRERSNTALGFGIAGTALSIAALWGRGGGIGNILGGGGASVPANVNINGGLGLGTCAPSTFDVYKHECEDVLALTSALYNQRINSLQEATAARNVDVNEKFQLYKSQIDADFGLYINNRNNIDSVNNRINNELFSLYKYTRDKDDETNARLCKLEKEAAVNTAIRPYQDELIMSKIGQAFEKTINYVDRLDCRNLKGVNTLPLTPTVTGVTSYCCCSNQPAAAAGA